MGTNRAQLVLVQENQARHCTKKIQASTSLQSQECSVILSLNVPSCRKEEQPSNFKSKDRTEILATIVLNNLMLMDTTREVIDTVHTLFFFSFLFCENSTYSFNALMVMLIYWEMLVLLRSKKKAKQKS